MDVKAMQSNSSKNGYIKGSDDEYWMRAFAEVK